MVLDGALSGPLNRPHLEPARIVYGGEVTLDADQADGDFQTHRYLLRGHVRLHETDTTLRAGEVTFDGGGQRATAADALLTRGVFSLRAPKIDGAPDLITAANGDFTTVPNGGPADAHVRAQTITLDQTAHRGVLRNAGLYLFGARLLTVPRVTFHLGRGGGAAGRHAMIPVFGASARYGTYVSFGSGLRLGSAPLQYRLLLPTRQSVEATLTGKQTLYAPRPPSATPPARPSAGPVTLLDRIRALATLPLPPLPEGDPLLFFDFLPEPNPIRLSSSPSRGGLDLTEELAAHIAAQGRRRDDLYVTRLPEVTLTGQVPLTRLPAAPQYGDPQAFRNSLRHVVVYADAQETLGNYREQPTNTRARRARTQLGLSARPLLIGPNTVLLPRVSVSSSSYSGSKDAYRYTQLDIAVNHYFSDLTALGIQFLASATGGDSPFNFDVLDTSRELDVRLQLGNRRLVTAGRVRYDMSKSSVIDYQIAVAPALRGLTPVFSYNFRTRSLGLGIEIKGVTY